VSYQAALFGLRFAYLLLVLLFHFLQGILKDGAALRERRDLLFACGMQILAVFDLSDRTNVSCVIVLVSGHVWSHLRDSNHDLFGTNNVQLLLLFRCANYRLNFTRRVLMCLVGFGISG
jgi:hypothetical protein